MDASAISLARENSIPMIVFSIEKQTALIVSCGMKINLRLSPISKEIRLMSFDMDDAQRRMQGAVSALETEFRG